MLLLIPLFLAHRTPVPAGQFSHYITSQCLEHGEFVPFPRGHNLRRPTLRRQIWLCDICARSYRSLSRNVGRYVCGPISPKMGANRLAASAVRYLGISTKRWVECVTLDILCYVTRFAFEAEFIAICEAFRIAYTLIEHSDRLFILSDCERILKGLK